MCEFTERIKKFSYIVNSIGCRWGKCGKNAYWRCGKERLIICGKGQMDDYNISDRILAEQRLPMVRPWDRYIKDIRSIVIKKGVTHIGSYAFWGMSAKYVLIPDGVKSIGYSALCLSEASADIYIPDGVETVSCVAFPGYITSIRVPVFANHLSYASICSIPALEKIYFAGTSEEWDSLWVKEYICSRMIKVYYNCE